MNKSESSSIFFVGATAISFEERDGINRVKRHFVELKRFDPAGPYAPSDAATMEEDKEGEYIKREDVLALIERLKYEADT